MNVEQLWASLASSPSPASGLARLAAGGPQNGRVYAALEHPGAGQVLLLRVPRAEVRDVSAQDGEGLQLCWLLLDEEPAHAFLALAPRATSYREVFARVAQDVAEHVVTTAGGGAAVGALMARLRHWRAFLRARGSGLDELALRGLFGELWFIRERLLPHVPVERVLSAWTGPGGAAQDFRFALLRLDVKTSAGPDAAIEISSAEQLDVPAGQRLLLAHLLLESKAAGESVNDLITGLRAATAGNPAAGRLLQERLLQADYHDADAGRYEDRRFSVMRAHLYEVTGAFPRITPGLLPAGVTGVRYSIDPGRCAPFVRDPAAMLTGLGGST